jgi:hypothetical protein
MVKRKVIKNKKINECKIALGVFLVIFLLILIYPFFSPNSDFEDSSLSLPEYENLLLLDKDFFSGTSLPHFGHMPITYSFMNECYSWELELTREGFNKISEETGGIISFEEDNENPDISSYCEKHEDAGLTIAEAGMVEFDESKNLILKGEITFYGQGFKCSTGYPALEIHEILHVFGIPHSAMSLSIMSPYAESSSRDCETKSIDKDYIDCLKYVYSNGSVEGDCIFSSYINDENTLSFPNYEYISDCDEGWFPVTNDDNSCCPEPNMYIDSEGYCA